MNSKLSCERVRRPGEQIVTRDRVRGRIRGSHDELVPRHSAGQVIIEYVLLLTVSMGIALIIMRTLASRNPDSPGALLHRWNHITKEIGRDDPNKSK